MNCVAENRKMQRICRKYGAELHFDHGEVVGRVLPALPTYISLWQEALDNSSSLMLTAMDLRERSAAFRRSPAPAEGACQNDSALPLTLSLSHWERERPHNGCEPVSLSLWERAGVRGDALCIGRQSAR